jgi:hypothetical protein
VRKIGFAIFISALVFAVGCGGSGGLHHERFQLVLHDMPRFSEKEQSHLRRF